MAIIYNKENQIFTLHTKHSTYQMKVDEYQILLHLYYGRRISSYMDYMIPYYDRGFSGNPYDASRDRTYSLDILPQEFPVLGMGDYRSYACKIREKNGCYGCDLRYVGFEVSRDKYALPGLPAVYAELAETLVIHLRDERIGAEITLFYGVLEDIDVITRSVKVTNIGKDQFFFREAFQCLSGFSIWAV